MTAPATPPSAKPPSKHSPLLPAIVAGSFGIAIALIQLYSPTRAEGPCAKVGRISLVSPQGGEDPRFEGIRKVLSAEDCPLGEAREESNRRRNEIRYFHSRDRAAAEAISALLVRKNTVDAVPRFLASEADERPAGQLELWLDRGK